MSQNLIKNYLIQLKQIKNLDQRASLYSNFKKYKELNPNIFKINVDFWSTVLKECCLKGWLPFTDELRFNLGFTFDSEFRQLFELDGEIPLALEAVLEELFYQGEIATFNTYVTQKKPLLITPNWSTQLVNNVFSSFFGSVQAPNFQGQVIVFKPITQSLLNTLLNFISNEIIIYPVTDALFNYEEFFEEVLPKAFINTEFSTINWCKLNETGLKLFLRCLQEVGVAIQVNDLTSSPPDCQLKFPEPSVIKNYLNKTTSQLSTPPLNDIDLNILNLKRTIASLNIQTRKLNHQIDIQTSLAKESIQKSMHSRAKIQLKKKKQIELTLTQSDNSLNNLIEILFGIRDAHSDSEILEVYQLGLTGLNELLGKKDLNEDQVMDHVADTLAEVNQISQAMNIEIDPRLEDELEDEFNQLLKNEGVKSHETKNHGAETQDQDIDNIINQLEGLQIAHESPTSSNQQTVEESKLNPILN